MTNAADWGGGVGDVWAAEWRRTDRSFAALSHVLDGMILASAPQRAFRALDIGCGAGGTSLALASARQDASILGIDLSEALVRVAKERAAALVAEDDAGRGDGVGVGSLSGVPARSAAFDPAEQSVAGSEAVTTKSVDLPTVASEQPLRAALKSGDGSDVLQSDQPTDATVRTGDIGGLHSSASRPRSLTFRAGDVLTQGAVAGPFDLFYSRHGVMFFDDPVATFAALRASARPGAKMVFSCFRDWSLNAFAREVSEALGGARPEPGPGPFAFADADHVSSILAQAGWRRASATPVDFAYRAGGGSDPVADALSFLQRIGPAASRIRMAQAEERPALIDRLATVIAARCRDGAVDFPAAAWIWSAEA